MCSLYISYNRYHGVFRKVLLLFYSGRDSCMLTSRCMLPWLRSVLVETRACGPRDACYPGCDRHLTPLYVPVSPWARSATCKPVPMVLVPDSTVHCSRPPAHNLHLSSSDHTVGPWVGPTPQLATKRSLVPFLFLFLDAALDYIVRTYLVPYCGLPADTSDIRSWHIIRSLH